MDYLKISMKYKNCILTSVLACLILACFTSQASVPKVSDNINVDAANVSCDIYQMMYDPEKKIVYVFAPDDGKSVKVTVTPRSGWSWNTSKTNPDTAPRTVDVKRGSRSLTLHGSNGEGDFTFSLEIKEVIAYVEIRPYLGINMIRSTDKTYFKEHNYHSASVTIIPNKGFEVAKDKTCKWSVGNSGNAKVEIDETTQTTQKLGFWLKKTPSSREKAETASVTVKGTYKGKEAKLSGSASFTIVLVDVCAAETREDKEDDPGVVLERYASFNTKTVKFTCRPNALSEKAQKISISAPAGALLEKSVDRYPTTYLPADMSGLTARTVGSKTYYLNTANAQLGEISIEHEKSKAVDRAKYVCWGFDFIKPAGDPVNNPDDNPYRGQNEFCYDETRDCTVELVVGVVPQGFSGVKLADVKKAYKNASFSVDEIKESVVKLAWDPAYNGSSGKWSDKGSITCTARAIYKGMPKRSDSFGLKNARFSGGTRNLSAKFELFFPKYGHGHPMCKDCDGCANWFYYWKQGAVPGLNSPEVKYNASLPDGRYGQATYKDGKALIEVADLAAEIGKEFKIAKYYREAIAEKGKRDIVLPGSEVMVGAGPHVKGVAFAAATILHERQHIAIYKAGDGKPDKDGDQVSNDCESKFGFVTYVDIGDSYNFNSKDEAFEKVYGGKSDDEIRARLAERSVSAKDYAVAQDWAKPGCQSIEAFGPDKK